MQFGLELFVELWGWRMQQFVTQPGERKPFVRENVRRRWDIGTRASRPQRRKGYTGVRTRDSRDGRAGWTAICGSDPSLVY